MLSSVKAPKILAVASAVDLDFRYGCTPAWWQLWKGMYEVGIDLIVTPYRGRPVESPWWRTAPNPTWVEGESFAAVRGGLARLKGDRYLRRAEESPDETVFDKATREAIWRWVTPRWRRHLTKVLEAEKDVDAVIVFTVPMAHFRGIPTYLRERFGVPVDLLRRRRADEPARVRRHGHGLQLLPRRRSVRVRPRASRTPRAACRACSSSARKRAEAVFWGADPEFFAPKPVEKLHDVFFYGYGDKFRRDWMAAMVGEPSRAAPELEFALGGRDFQGDTGRAWLVGDIPFNAFNQAISASRINLNITRRSHATVPASSSCRPFELASAGAAIVSNPYEGIERWFEPGHELLVVNDADEALTVYRSLLDDPAQAEAMGARARERVLDEHTYAHRARQLLSLVGLGVPAGARA